MHYLKEIFPIILMVSYVTACFQAACYTGNKSQFQLAGQLFKTWGRLIIEWYFVLTVLLLIYRLAIFAWTGTWG